MDIVEVHHAVSGYAAEKGRQGQLGAETPPGSGQNGNHDRTDTIRDRIAGEHENGPVASGSSGEPDLTVSHRSSPTNPRLLPNPL